MQTRYTLLFLLLSFSTASVFAQVTINNNCDGAIFLPNVSNFCSGVGEFNNNTASASAIPFPSCFPGSQSQDVWFVFTAVRTRVSIRVIGATAFFEGGTLRNPTVAVYSGNCGNLNEIACAIDNDNSSVVTTAAAVNVGESYFIRVDTRGGNRGDFQICITSFDPVPDPSSDCNPAVLLCDKSPFIVPFLSSNGNDPDEVEGPPCVGTPVKNCSYEELQSAWYKWICKDAGTLTLNLTPLNPIDDLDFWIYELPNGIDDCSTKEPLLCMASGAISLAPISDWIICHGSTGLREGETDDHEDCGCDSGDNNYIRPLQMEAGKAYAMVIMNFSGTNDGFQITFGGTGTFVGPDIDFEIDPELDNQCDIDSVLFIDNSVSGIGDIIAYEWNFGIGATPRQETTEGPHEVVYNSFGTKNIVLRITTSAGCSKTEIKEIFIEPCCDPANDLELDILDRQDPLCPGIASGTFTVGGSGGSPAYLYSTDGTNFVPITQYNGLDPGLYSIWIQDIKGCRDSVDVVISDPPPFEVDAGPDQTIQLGFDTDLRATVFGNPPYDFEWLADTSLDCRDCLDPSVFPSTTTTYYFSATNTVGCRAIDSVTVFVEVVRPVYIPSGFSPNGDGINDYFTIYAGPQVRQIERLLVFDRWGNLVYEGTQIPPNSETLGWDGTFKGKPMDSAVFAYFAEVLFIDGAILPFEGDITLVR